MNTVNRTNIAPANSPSDPVGEIKQKLLLNNRLMQILKDVAVLLVEIATPEDIATKVLPLIRQALASDEEPLLYVDPAGGPIISSMANEDLARINTALHLRDDFSTNAIVMAKQDLLTDAALSVLADWYNAPYVIISSISHDLAQMGFLAVPVQDENHAASDVQKFLKFLGEIIGIFLKNVQLRQEYQKSKQELEQSYKELLAVYDISNAISSDMELNAILGKALDTILAHDILQIEAKGGIFLMNENTGRLDMVCYRGIDKFLVNTEGTIPLGHCLCGIAAQTGEIITSENCFTDERHHTRHAGMQPHGHIIIPLSVKQKILGVLFLYLPAGVSASRGQIDMLSSIASQLAVTIENATLYERVKHLSQHDSLTGLANRSLMHEQFKKELDRARRYQRPLAVAMVDIDYFKSINDTHGHPAGDAILRGLSHLMVLELRTCDMIARYGGEEFLLLLPETDREGAQTALERVRLVVEKHWFAIDHSDPIHITISLGLSMFDPEKPADAPTLIKAADDALYQAKQAGRNRLVVAKL